MLKYNSLFHSHNTAWKVPKYAVFSGPYFPVVGLNTPYSVQIKENKDQKKLCIWTLFTQGNLWKFQISFITCIGQTKIWRFSYLFDLSNWPSQSNFEAFTLDNFLVNGHYLWNAKYHVCWKLHYIRI